MDYNHNYHNFYLKESMWLIIAKYVHFSCKILFHFLGILWMIKPMAQNMQDREIYWCLGKRHCWWNIGGKIIAMFCSTQRSHRYTNANSKTNRNTEICKAPEQLEIQSHMITNDRIILIQSRIPSEMEEAPPHKLLKYCWNCYRLITNW